MPVSVIATVSTAWGSSKNDRRVLRMSTIRRSSQVGSRNTSSFSQTIRSSARSWRCMRRAVRPFRRRRRRASNCRPAITRASVATTDASKLSRSLSDSCGLRGRSGSRSMPFASSQSRVPMRPNCASTEVRGSAAMSPSVRRASRFSRRMTSGPKGRSAVFLSRRNSCSRPDGTTPASPGGTLEAAAHATNLPSAMPVPASSPVAVLTASTSAADSENSSS